MSPEESNFSPSSNGSPAEYPVEFCSLQHVSNNMEQVLSEREEREGKFQRKLLKEHDDHDEEEAEETEEQDEDNNKEGEEEMANNWKRSSSSPGPSDFFGRWNDCDELYSLRDQKRKKLSPLLHNNLDQQHYPRLQESSDTVTGNVFDSSMCGVVMGNYNSSSSSNFIRRAPAEARNNSLVTCDSPHPRHVCLVFPFIPPPCLSNTAHCNKVFTFYTDLSSLLLSSKYDATWASPWSRFGFLELDEIMLFNDMSDLCTT
jgi:hypothetical protein